MNYEINHKQKSFYQSIKPIKEPVYFIYSFNET